MAALAQTNFATTATNSLAEGLRDIKPPVAIPMSWEWVLWVAGGMLALLLLLGLLALVIILIVKSRRANQPPLIPAHQRAKDALDDALKLLSQPKPFVIAVSSVLRTYLEERFQFHAPERTTEEFLHELQATLLLNPAQKQSLGEFLQRCDLVKFAKYEPTEFELRELHGAAYRLVEETEPKPAPAPGAQAATLPASPDLKHQSPA